MQNNNSKFLYIIIGILSVLVIVLLAVQYSSRKSAFDNGPVEEFPMNDSQTQDNQNGYSNTNTSTWVKSLKFGLWYPPNARITESYYLSPVEQGNGSLPYMGIPYAEFLDFPNSDMTIIWGGAQSGCGDGDYDFQYGVSEITCVKGMKAYMGTQDVRKGITASDKKIFGDFVIKNK